MHYPDSDNFTIWDAKQQEVRPACRVEPSNATEVADVLSILLETSCHFAVKGGGHGRSPGDSNAIAGVTIDLDRTSTIEIAEDDTSARVGGGATSRQVYAALEPRNLSGVLGRVGQVGIGGFTLGGGTYPFANKYGWALDNVYEYEVSAISGLLSVSEKFADDFQKVVLANCSIVTASEDQNPDLFFALRGGSNNFGIVTSFQIRTFPQGPIFVSQNSYSDDQTEAVLDKVYDLFTDPQLSGNVEMGYDMYYTYSQQNDRFIMSGTQRYETPMMNPPVFSEIDQIPTLSRSARNATMANLTGATPRLGTTRYVLSQRLHMLCLSIVLANLSEIFSIL